LRNWGQQETSKFVADSLSDALKKTLQSNFPPRNVEQPNGIGWNKLHCMEQEQGRLHIKWNMMKVEQGGLHIRWNGVEQETGLCQAQPVHLFQHGTTRR